MLNKILILLAFFLLLPFSASAKLVGSQTAGVGAVIDYSWAESVQIPLGPHSGLPAGAVNGGLYLMTDTTTDSCSGGGSSTVLCMYTSFGWMPVNDPENVVKYMLESIGVGAGAVDMGTFTGTTIPDSSTTKEALQELETAVEVHSPSVLNIPTGLAAAIPSSPAAGSLYYVTDGAAAADCSTGLGTVTVLCLYNGTSWHAVADPDGYRADIQTLTGTAEGDTDLASFTGTTIPDGQTIKTAIQALETAVEVRNTSPTALNVFTSDDCSLVSGMAAGDLCFEY